LSSRAILTHSIEDLIEVGLKTEEDWPGYKNGAKKWDNGILPIKHLSITFKADKGHRVRGYAKKYFALASLPKAKNLGVTKLDAERMK
jgi:hypothetical protein